MKKSSQILLILSSTMLLASCGPSANSTAVSSNLSSLTSASASSTTTTSVSTTSASSTTSVPTSSSSSSSTATGPSFSAVATLLGNLSEQEATLANKVQVTQRTSKTNFEDISDETYTLTKDGSSFSKGTLSEKESGNTTKTDSFVRRYVEQNDQIKDSGGTIATYPMLYQVTDHEKDTFTANDYQDSATKYFVVDSAADATKIGLSSGEYVLTSEAPAVLGAQAIAHLLSFLDTTIINNDYVNQLGLKTFTQEGHNYSFNATYSYDGDLDDTQTFIIAVSFTLDNQDLYLSSLSYSLTNKDQSKSDPTDVYTTTSAYEAVLTYGTRGEESAPIDVNDYFLAGITDIQICNSDSERSKADPKAFSLTNSYLFAKAGTYTPAKATNLTLVNGATSNSDVIALTTDGYFEVKAAGKTTLTFTYFGRLDSGIYEERSITAEITVVAPNATELTLFDVAPAVVENTLYIGTAYKMATSITPSKASQAIKVTSGDEKILTASTGTNNEDVVLTPVAEGSATITVASVANPSLTKTMTFTIKTAVDDNKYLAKLTSTTYLYTNTTYGYSFAITFKTDGTGSRLQTMTSSGKTYTDTFTYVLKGTALTFDNWSDGAIHCYQSGLIAKEGTELVLDDSSSSMVTDTYEAQ